MTPPDERSPAEGRDLEELLAPVVANPIGFGHLVDDLGDLGVSRVFTPGATTQEIIRWVQENIRPREVA